ncbi:hypothetical protein FRC08_008418 [Ceratobasidium sp. 394]|nr:hypothetical protein FRC08_008418 [Ceratobasidium sp. 394]
MIILLAQLQNDDFLTREVIQLCSPDLNPLSVLIGYPEDSNAQSPLSESNETYAYQVLLQTKYKVAGEYELRRSE